MQKTGRFAFQCLFCLAPPSCLCQFVPAAEAVAVVAEADCLISRLTWLKSLEISSKHCRAVQSLAAAAAAVSAEPQGAVHSCSFAQLVATDWNARAKKVVSRC